MEEVEKVVIIAQEDLAKSGYKPNIKDRSLIILLLFWLHTKNQVQKSGDSNYFPSHLVIEDLKIHIIFYFRVFEFLFFGEIPPIDR
jgi:hypothetical protein